MQPSRLRSEIGSKPSAIVEICGGEVGSVHLYVTHVTLLKRMAT